MEVYGLWPSRYSYHVVKGGVMSLNIFGFDLTIMELISVGSLLTTLVAGWIMLKNKVLCIEEKVSFMELEVIKRGQSIAEMAEKLEKKLEPLQNQVRLQEQAQAALNANLASIQTQLQTVSVRLDTIITHMLTKDRL